MQIKFNLAMLSKGKRQLNCKYSGFGMLYMQVDVYRSYTPRMHCMRLFDGIESLLNYSRTYAVRRTHSNLYFEGVLI